MLILRKDNRLILGMDVSINILLKEKQKLHCQ